MSSFEKSNTWFRIAANVRAIKEGEPDRHWRCFIDPENEVFTLSHYDFKGEINERNCIPGSNTTEGIDPRAWLAMYGDVVIADGVAHFVLKTPPIQL